MNWTGSSQRIVGTGKEVKGAEGPKGEKWKLWNSCNAARRNRESWDWKRIKL